MTTLCEHCVFSKRENSVQVGCHLDRLDKLPHHQEGNHFVVDDHCRALRNVYWDEYVLDPTLDNLKEKVNAELKITYDVIMVCNDESYSDIYKTLSSIQSKSFQPQRVHVCFKYAADFGARDLIHRVISLFPNSMYSANISTEEDLGLRLRPAIHKSTATFLLFVNPGHDYDEAIVSEIDNSINVELKPRILFVSEEFYVCPRILYKQFMYEPSPFEKINEYIQSTSTN